MTEERDRSGSPNPPYAGEPDRGEGRDGSPRDGFQRDPTAAARKGWDQQNGGGVHRGPRRSRYGGRRGPADGPADAGGGAGGGGGGGGGGGYNQEPRDQRPQRAAE